MPKLIAPRILFEDPNLIVLSKPAGLLSQEAEKGELNLVDWLRNYFGRYYVGLVHRLDRNVSGLMVVAKRSKAAARLTQSLQSGELERRYLAWLCGTLSGPKRWEHILLKDEKLNQVKVVNRSTSKAKQAILTVTPVRNVRWQNMPLTLAEFKLETGRSHQIRAQAAYENFPLLGDVKYGRAGAKDNPKISRPMLHSYLIAFPHPISQKKLKFQEDLPDDMKPFDGK